jgi:hypothetical protein
MFTTFYNETIRKTVIGFGSLFDDIFVQRFDSSGNLQKKILVPISYSPKEKFIRMLREYPLLKGDGSDVHIGEVLPRMGFSITSIDYDGSRKRNTVFRRFTDSAVNTDTGLVEQNNSQFTEVPYNVGFNLAIGARSTDDCLQIVEQILPYFTPEFTLTINFTDSFNTRIDVPIILNSVSPEFEYEGDTSTQRNVTFNLGFTALSYVFSPIKTNKIIRRTDVTTLVSGFNTDGSITGPTGAIARTISSITGPSGASSMPPNASVTTENFEFGSITGGLSITGATIS